MVNWELFFAGEFYLVGQLEENLKLSLSLLYSIKVLFSQLKFKIKSLKIVVKEKNKIPGVFIQILSVDFQ
jgi:hypothetical protein